MPEMTWNYGSPIDVELIRAFEREFGKTLPASYVAIAAQHDSSIAEPDSIPFSTPDRECGWSQMGIGQLLSYVEEWDPGVSAIRWVNRRFAELTPDFIVFSNSNGWEFAFDYGVREIDPPVVLFTYDRSLSGQYCIPVANSFDDLLARVRDSEDETPPANLLPFEPGPRLGKGRFE